MRISCGRVRWAIVTISGFTNFLAFAISFSVMLMIHVHCFYACACKVYSSQLKAAISLGKMSPLSLFLDP